MSAFIRGALIVIGLLVMLGGLIAISALPGMAIGGLVWVVMGGILVVAVLFERQRYRSEASERGNAQPGPGGGEPAGDKLEPRFRVTDEAFIDPTTGIRMRVAVDPATGERRYVAQP
jgi:hypothetical protein